MASSCPSMLSQMQDFLGPLVNRTQEGWVEMANSLFLFFFQSFFKSSFQSFCPFSLLHCLGPHTYTLVPFHPGDSLLGHLFHNFPPPSAFLFCSRLQLAEGWGMMGWTESSGGRLAARPSLFPTCVSKSLSLATCWVSVSGLERASVSCTAHLFTGIYVSPNSPARPCHTVGMAQRLKLGMKAQPTGAAGRSLCLYNVSVLLGLSGAILSICSLSDF